jgi:hypothetical protein
MPEQLLYPMIQFWYLQRNFGVRQSNFTTTMCNFTTKNVQLYCRSMQFHDIGNLGPMTSVAKVCDAMLGNASMGGGRW